MTQEQHGQQAMEKGGGKRQEAPFSASQQAWRMELCAVVSRASSRRCSRTVGGC